MQTRKKSARRGLLVSATSLLLCVAMLVGTTFAWFTDSVSSGTNKIQAGNLDVEVLDKSGNSIKGSDQLFTVPELWEPGAVAVAQVNVVNKGTLDLKYKLSLNFQDVNSVDGHKLSEVLKCAVIDDYQENMTREQVIAAAAAAGNHSDLSGLGVEGYLYARDNANSESNKPSETGLQTLVVYWEPSENDNLYNVNNGKTTSNGAPLQINLGVNVVATQLNSENDSFGPDYDREAVYPTLPNIMGTTVSGTILKNNTTTLNDSVNNVAITIPDGAVTENTKAVFSMKLTENQPNTVTYQIDLINEQGNSVTLSKPATVTAEIGKNLRNVTVKHNDTDMNLGSAANALNDQEYSYDPNSGIVYICTKSFSPFQMNFEFDGAASVNGVAYASINAAILAAQDGQTVAVMKDIESDSVPINYWPDGNKEVTVDLQNHTVTYTGKDYRTIQVVQDSGANAKLTVKNGTVIASGQNSDGVDVFRGADVTLHNVSIRASDIGVAGFNAESNITLEGCTVESNYYGVYLNGSEAPSTITVKNCTIKDSLEDGAGIYVSNSAGREKQTLTVENSTVSGATAIEIKHTDAEISATEMIATQEPPAYVENNNGSTSIGYCFAITSNTKDGHEDETTGTINFSNCTFKPKAAGCDVFNASSIGGATITGYNSTVYSPDMIPVNASNVQAYLDGQYGSIDGKTLVLSAGEYPQLELGRATKYPGSNTDYYIGEISNANKKTYGDFVAIKNSGQWSPSAYYVRNMSNVTIKAADGAAVKVAGMVGSSGHVYGNVYDYVLDKSYTSGSAYYLTHKWNNITFEGIQFTSNVDIATSSPDTEIDGVTFRRCSFTTGDTASTDGQALRYYNEANNGKVKNLTVDQCTFNTCYQGVYTQKINGVTVINSSFDTTGHNAIAVQSYNKAVNHKAVVITGNTFANIGDRIIRFGDVGADTQITIQNNKATNSGNSKGEVIKAESLAEGVTYTISNNNWGKGKNVANTQFQDRVSTS